ncbi:MAG: hypothetical protein JSV13_09495 [Nitrospiraceae bacterium]|nr:MAG: hypothetical protein JSV13_09495 [Nitrospiraceae bacterium]
MFLEKEREKMNGRTRHMGMLPVLLAAVIALIMGITASESWAINFGFIENEFSETAIFFEENATDGDLGIQIFFDGEPWMMVRVFSPEDSTVFNVMNGGSLMQIGSTEVFTESAEPSFDELPREELLALFTEGEYTFLGTIVGGGLMVGTAMLTHDLPVPVDVALVVNGDSAIIEWVDKSEDGDPEIVGFEVVIEMVVEDDSGEERVFVNTATFPASVTSFTISQEFISAAFDFFAEGELLEVKFEVIAIEESGNKTITEQIVFEAEE